MVKKTEIFKYVGYISYIMAANETLLFEYIFLKPMTELRVRELSRQSKLDTKTVMKYLNEFAKRKLIIKKQEKHKYPYYEPNRLSLIYKHEKSELLIRKIIESSLIEYLGDALSPEAIVLFGSVQKGTYHEESDIDLFMQTNYKKLDLLKFEKKLGHKINLLFEKNLKKLSEGLLTNIYNGLVLYGQLEVVK